VYRIGEESSSLSHHLWYVHTLSWLAWDRQKLTGHNTHHSRNVDVVRNVTGWRLDLVCSQRAFGAKSEGVFVWTSPQLQIAEERKRRLLAHSFIFCEMC